MMPEYNEFSNSYLDINECTSRGACSVSPTIAALEELVMSFLQQISHYILLLEDFGASNKKIKYSIISTLAALVSVNEFSDIQLHSIVVNAFYILTEVKKIYHKLCKEKGIQPKDLKRSTQFNSSTTVAKTISMGEKLTLNNYNKYSSEQKNLIEILRVIVKSVSLNISKLDDFDVFDQDAYHEIIEILDTFNHGRISSQNLLNKISKLAALDNKLQLLISEKLLSVFEGISETRVAHSTSKGKAILVSGNNFFDLLNILESTKNEDIDIYTHSNLLITHALNKFKRYKNLKGHYGNSTETCVVDFATFPGSILLTKNSQNNTEYLYRGRLFSNDYIVPNGVIKLENGNYRPLIEAAKASKGFSKEKLKEESICGYNERFVSDRFDDIIKKLNKGKIKRLYIVGIDAHLEGQKEYFRQFFSKLHNDEYVISFSYYSDRENVLTINIGNYVPLATSLLHKLFTKYSIESQNVLFLFTTCDVMTISSIVTLKDANAKHLYMAKCLPTQINPAVFETMSNIYGIKLTDNAVEDLKMFRNNKSTQ